jgi:hypothetical protein
MKKEQVQQAQQAIEVVRLYDYDAPQVPELPWKFSVEDNDWFWPVKWLLYPLTDEAWVVKRVSPNNELAAEAYEWVGIEVDGKLVFKTREWSNEIVQVWDRKSVLAFFEDVRSRKLSGVALEENFTQEEKEESEKTLRLLKVIRMMLEDAERIIRYGEAMFSRYIEYYSKWEKEFGEFFKELAKMGGEERIRYLGSMKEILERKLYETGYFMYVYYP